MQFRRITSVASLFLLCGMTASCCVAAPFQTRSGRHTVHNGLAHRRVG